MTALIASVLPPSQTHRSVRFPEPTAVDICGPLVTANELGDHWDRHRALSSEDGTVPHPTLATNSERAPPPVTSQLGQSRVSAIRPKLAAEDALRRPNRVTTHITRPGRISKQ